MGLNKLDIINITLFLLTFPIQKDCSVKHYSEIPRLAISKLVGNIILLAGHLLVHHVITELTWIKPRNWSQNCNC